jgi:hypothetical protein
MKKDTEQMKKYTDFKERFQKVLKCDEKPVRAIRLDELYREVYDYYGNNWGGLTPEIFTCFGLLLEDIWKAIEDAGESYPGFQKQVESFLKAINKAKQYTPKKKLAAADNIITNAVAIKTNDPRTEKRMQGVIYLGERLKAEALQEMAPKGAGENVEDENNKPDYRVYVDEIDKDNWIMVQIVEECKTKGWKRGTFINGLRKDRPQYKMYKQLKSNKNVTDRIHVIKRRIKTSL